MTFTPTSARSPITPSLLPAKPHPKAALASFSRQTWLTLAVERKPH